MKTKYKVTALVLVALFTPCWYFWLNEKIVVETESALFFSQYSDDTPIDQKISSFSSYASGKSRVGAPRYVPVSILNFYQTHWYNYSKYAIILNSKLFTEKNLTDYYKKRLIESSYYRERYLVNQKEYASTVTDCQNFVNNPMINASDYCYETYVFYLLALAPFIIIFVLILKIK